MVDCIRIAWIILASSYGIAMLVISTSLLSTTIDAEYDCSAKEDGWYYDPEFCHVYWRCTHGAAEEFECHSGTAWDHHANQCGWIDSVDCSREEKTTAKISSEEEEEDEGDEATGENEAEDDTSVVIVSKPKKKKKKNTNQKRTSDSDGDDFHRENMFNIICCMNACLLLSSLFNVLFY